MHSGSTWGCHLMSASGHRGGAPLAATPNLPLSEALTSDWGVRHGTPTHTHQYRQTFLVLPN